MKQHKLRKQLKKIEQELGLIETDPSVVGYALYHTEKKAFVELLHSEMGLTDAYTGDLEAAYIADSQLEALNTYSKLEDGWYIKIVPLIQNDLFGLTPKPDYLKD
ncbi:hypothetical protein OFV45_000768 [Salmonella enterica]|uniref:hypothetical protein n=1 Tax=Salmonella enterica TaxID=28901 RepID=UPI000A191698|nr:hypothetical protein [Salmonella enterica]EDJ4262322.1 hypothetical protein [Salmonella enterica subsp. enterica serovar Muenchen]EDR3484011.1 hypothetical protein [Salmonella enterica subsp. enterica serovar Midway]EDS5859589.1 hypothetical protein [Salmonella enterica subsp. enterica serovar Gaminara]EDX7009228.1 hypothetical protein [Salmonella enterica subsp. enterica serovar Thompson]EFO5651589.1 hypothetical protein [Salmonella enterica subsp. enterica serovar Miami]